MKALQCPACNAALDGKDPSRCPYCGSWLAVDEGVLVVDQIQRAVGSALAADRQERERLEAQQRLDARRQELYAYLEQTQQMLVEKQKSGGKAYPDLKMADLRAKETEAIDLLQDEFGDERERVPKRIMLEKVWILPVVIAVVVFIFSGSASPTFIAFMMAVLVIAVIERSDAKREGRQR